MIDTTGAGDAFAAGFLSQWPGPPEAALHAGVKLAAQAVTQPGGRPALRISGMPEAVIVDAIRTPIGRAVKGSLKDVRTDDLAAIPLRALVERNPEVDFGETIDVMMGCGFGVGEAG